MVDIVRPVKQRRRKLVRKHQQLLLRDRLQHRVTVRFRLRDELRGQLSDSLNLSICLPQPVGEHLCFPIDDYSRPIDVRNCVMERRNFTLRLYNIRLQEHQHLQLRIYVRLQHRYWFLPGDIQRRTALNRHLLLLRHCSRLRERTHDRFDAVRIGLSDNDHHDHINDIDDHNLDDHIHNHYDGARVLVQRQPIEQDDGQRAELYT